MDRNSMTFEANTRKMGISGSTLKLVAIFTMLIDHTAATILDSTLIKGGMYSLNYNDSKAVQDFNDKYGTMLTIDHIMRYIGRLAFPIFCFLLVEGMIHTHSRLNYTIRLAIFAIISEIPFDLAFTHQPFYWDYQNVYFTLLIGLLVLIGFDTVNKALKDKKWLPVLAILGTVAAGYVTNYVVSRALQVIYYKLMNMGYNVSLLENGIPANIMIFTFSVLALLLFFLLCKIRSISEASVFFTDMAVLATGILLADYLNTDYSGFGILTIAVIYGLRRSPVIAMFGGCTTLTIMTIGEVTAFFDLFLMSFYNGKRGLKLKYVFYLFYPVHLLLLYLICYFMKIV